MVRNKYKIDLLSISICVSLFLGCSAEQLTSPTLDVKAIQTAALTSPLLMVDVPVVTVYRTLLNNNDSHDHMNVASFSNEYPSVPSPYKLEGPSWYFLENNNYNSSVPIYELFGVNNGMGDHMPSLSTVEANYGGGGMLGYVLTTANVMGMQPVNRYVNYYSSHGNTSMDHMVANFNEAPGSSGYGLERTFGYAWPFRTETASLTTANGSVIKADAAYGGAVTSLNVGGKEYVNIGGDPTAGYLWYKYGRLIQQAVFINGGVDNPTEAGSQGDATHPASPSPVAAFSGGGSLPITTKTYALNFSNRSPDNKDNRPLLTGTIIEKVVSLGSSSNTYKFSNTITMGKSFKPNTDVGLSFESCAHLNGGLFDSVSLYTWSSISQTWQKAHAFTRKLYPPPTPSPAITPFYNMSAIDATADETYQYATSKLGDVAVPSMLIAYNSGKNLLDKTQRAFALYKPGIAPTKANVGGSWCQWMAIVQKYNLTKDTPINSGSKAVLGLHIMYTDVAQGATHVVTRGDQLKWNSTIVLGATPQEILAKAPGGVLP